MRKAGSLVTLGATALSLSSHVSLAQEAAPQVPAKALLVPQVEGERQGKLVGRAIACGVARERADATLRTARAQMIATVGGPFTEDRYLPALDRALAFEANLGRPSEGACTKALDAFTQFEAAPGRRD